MAAAASDPEIAIPGETGAISTTRTTFDSLPLYNAHKYYSSPPPKYSPECNSRSTDAIRALRQTSSRWDDVGPLM